MAEHELKTWREPFAATWCGRKTAEFREDDRGFEEGDTLVLREWNEVRHVYTGRWIRTTITHKLDGGQFGIPAGYCMLSLGGGVLVGTGGFS